jgi:hypothetical protein
MQYDDEGNFKSTEKIKYINTYVELTKEVVAAVGYFHYAQHESEILVQQHMEYVEITAAATHHVLIHCLQTVSQH